MTTSPPVPDAPARRLGAVLDALLERVTYANEETGYTVARVATDRSGADLLTVGSLLGVQPGESLRLLGRWTRTPATGASSKWTRSPPCCRPRCRASNGTWALGLIRGIGPKMAARIVGQFGADTLRVIEEQPARLVEVPGLGPRRTAMIGRAWEEQKAVKEVMVFLQEQPPCSPAIRAPVPLCTRAGRRGPQQSQELPTPHVSHTDDPPAAGAGSA